jgi:hypothetical protein
VGFDAGEASMIGRSIGTVAPRRPSIFVQLGDGRIRESIAAGADRHLGKPLSAEALLTLVGELLQ